MTDYPEHDPVCELADLAARAVCEPRRFMENEDELQQKLGQAVARVRLQHRGVVEAERERVVALIRVQAEQGVITWEPRLVTWEPNDEPPTIEEP